MTRDEILNMPAGREMDALIAEYIFGQSRDMESARKVIQSPPMYDSRNVDYERLYDIFSLPSYSTDISSAWEIVEKLGLMVRPSVLSGKWVAMKFERVYLSGKWEGIGEVTADTAPLAICRAALLAKHRL